MYFDAKSQLTEDDWKHILDTTPKHDCVKIRKILTKLPAAAVQATYVESDKVFDTGAYADLVGGSRETTRTIARNYVAFIEHYERTWQERWNRCLAICAIGISIVVPAISWLLEVDEPKATAAPMVTEKPAN